MAYEPTPDVLLANGFVRGEDDSNYYALDLANECQLVVTPGGNLVGLLLYGPGSIFPDKIFDMQSESEFISGVSQLIALAEKQAKEEE